MTDETKPTPEDIEKDRAARAAARLGDQASKNEEPHPGLIANPRNDPATGVGRGSN